MTTGHLGAQLDRWGVDPPPTYPEMLLDFIEKLAQNQPLPAPAQSLEELDARRIPLKNRLRQSLGLDPWPERTELYARTAGTLERPGYRIEKLVYEAWPGLPVTAHLYIPAQLKGPAPALVYACGHWMEAGKLASTVQSFCASAARLGMITLVYDPIGQGERLESWQDHGNLGSLLVGRCQLGWMVWESIRALDYLLSRPEVHPEKIGMTGASGGGLNTLFTTAIEDRFACAIPVAYPCTFSAAMLAERDLNWEDGTDLCNQVPGVMSYAEMSDLAGLFIPRPYMILSGSRDRIFPITGTRQVAANIAHTYLLAGVPERFRFIEFDEEHGYPTCMREAACGWFRRWLSGEGDGSSIPEPELDLLPDPYPVNYMDPPNPTPEDVRSQSPTLIPVPGSLPGFCFPLEEKIRSGTILRAKVMQMAEEIPEYPPIPESLAGLPAWQEEIKRRVRAVLGPFPPAGPLHPRLFNQVCEAGLMVERITFESEPGITMPGLFIMPAEWKRPVPFVIYAGEWGKRQGIRSGLVEGLVRGGYGVLAIDVRGVGETAASDFEAATNSLMLDRPLFAQRVFDVLRAVDFLWERCYIAPQVDKGRLVILGEGVGGLWGLYAAALEDRIATVVALDTLFSYKALLEAGAHYPAGVYLFDVLRQFDLAHVMASIAPRPVYLQPVDGLRRKCTKRQVLPALKPVVEAFSRGNDVPGCFNLVTVKGGQDLRRWLDQVLYS